MKNKNSVFSEGDVVRIRPAENISRTLDSSNKHDGCLFMNQMWRYCGQKFKVIKVISNIFDEYKYRMYETKSPLYILNGIICDGEINELKHRCDRSCYFFWHEDWLEKP